MPFPTRHSPKTQIPTQEMTMSRFENLYRDVTCAAAAVLITLAISLSFVQSTSAAPFHVAAAYQQAHQAAMPAQQA